MEKEVQKVNEEKEVLESRISQMEEKIQKLTVQNHWKRELSSGKLMTT